ncbi:CBS domain protein [uncultured archaeon]|nr:CBS domain protein [uncultured archaeon]
MMLRDFKYSKMNSCMKKMCEQKNSLHEFYELKVKDLMLTKSDLLCVDEKTDIETVLSLLIQTDHVWVMDSTEPTHLLGVITESDTIVLLSPPLTSLQTFDKPDSRSLQYGDAPPAVEIMSKKPVTASPDETIREILLKMKEQKIKQLPVVDENEQFIGELSLSRLIQEYSNQQIDLVHDKN